MTTAASEWFVFRGERDYLHGATIFDYIVTEYAEKMGPPCHIDFIFMHKTIQHCRVVTEKQGESGLIATYSDDNGSFFLYETGVPITSRVAYDEPAAGERYLVEGDRVSISSRGGNSFIELAVAAYKGLLTALFPETRGRHILSRVQLEHIPEGSFEIHYRRKVAKRFYEGEIFVDGNPHGLIYFGV